MAEWRPNPRLDEKDREIIFRFMECTGIKEVQSAFRAILRIVVREWLEKRGCTAAPVPPTRDAGNGEKEVAEAGEAFLV